MGYDVERFTVDVDEELKCTICSDVLQDPLQISSCEHVFCGSCIQPWLAQNNTCPVDRKQTTAAELRQCRLLNNLLSNLKICCDNTGCTEVVALSCISSHLEECQANLQQLVKCQQGCGRDVKKIDVKEHNCINTLQAVISSKDEELKSNQELIQMLLEQNQTLLEEKQVFKEEQKVFKEHQSNVMEQNQTLLQENKVLKEHCSVPQSSSPQQRSTSSATEASSIITNFPAVTHLAQRPSASTNSASINIPAPARCVALPPPPPSVSCTNIPGLGVSRPVPSTSPAPSVLVGMANKCLAAASGQQRPPSVPPPLPPPAKNSLRSSAVYRTQVVPPPPRIRNPSPPATTNPLVMACRPRGALR